MPEPCIPTIDDCLGDPTLISCCSAVEAQRLRCILLARLKEVSCGCMSAPVKMGDVEYADPVDLMDALRRLIEMTYMVEMKSAELEGPVMISIYEDTCGSTPCPTRCFENTIDEENGKFHVHTEIDPLDERPGEGCSTP